METYLRECPRKKVLLILVLFSFFSFVKMFQFSFNFESYERLFFQQNSRVEFSFYFLRSFLLVSIPIGFSRSEWQTSLLTKFFPPWQVCPESPSSFWQIVEDSFSVLYCLGLLLPFPLWPKLSAACRQFVSLLEINFHNGNKRVLRSPQSSSITGTSPSDCLVSYPGHTLR